MAIYENMYEILEERKQGIAELQKFRAEGFQAFREGIPEGDYVRLLINNETMMSDTPMEKRTSSYFITNAYGNVLICGLGIGLVILPLLKNENIKSITVIEKYKDVIDCVLPQIEKYDTNNKLKVVNEDCFDFVTEDKFDTIFIDIWAYVNSDIYEEEMKPLKRKYRKFLSEYGKENNNIFVWAEYNAKHDLRLY